MSSKKRSANFSAKEESLLVSLAKGYKGVLECKISDMKTHNEKSECWLKIEKQFNSVSGEVHRPADVLRKKYENIKKRLKKKFSDEKCHARMTGGGPPHDFKFTDVDNEVKEILGKRVDGIPSEFDDDADTDRSINNTAHTEEILISNDVMDFDESEKNEDIITDNIVFVEHDYFIENCSDVYAPPAEVPSTSTTGTKKEPPHSVTDRVSQWAEAKTTLEESKNMFFKEECRLKLQHMQERHNQEIKKNELEIQWKKEEHLLRMEISQLEKAQMKCKK
ncbi:hypothetical protein RI129_001032 [Pyrocoelia pectoralis]|uniref:Regulatory protein zeste n=1 Tax=Pyrocoelia pectoralis TaxID=417401 RepID=A0AAN7ZWM7_9COLE